MNFTRIFSPLSRAQVQLLNAPLSYAAQRSHALPPCLLGKATKRFPCALPAVAVPRVLCWAPWQAASWALVRGWHPAAPRGSLSWVGEEAEAERARKRAQGRAGMRPGSCELGWGGGGSGAGARRMLARGWPGQGLCHPSRTASGQRRWQPDMSQGLGHSLLGVTQSSLDLVSSGSLGKSRTSGQFRLHFPRQITDCPSHLAARPRLLLQPAPAPQSPAVPGHQPRGAVPAQPSAPCPLLGAWQRGRATGPAPGAVPGFLQPFWREALRLQPFSPSCKYRAAEKRLGELNRAWDGVYENQVSECCVPGLPSAPCPGPPAPCPSLSIPEPFPGRCRTERWVHGCCKPSMFFILSLFHLALLHPFILGTGTPHSHFWLLIRAGGVSCWTAGRWAQGAGRREPVCPLLPSPGPTPYEGG